MCKCRPCSGAAYNWKEKGVIVNKILNCLQEKKIWICSCVYALLFSASIIAGSKLGSMEEGLPLSLGLKDLGIFLVWFIIIAIAAAVVSGALFLRAGGEARENGERRGTAGAGGGLPPARGGEPQAESRDRDRRRRSPSAARPALRGRMAWKGGRR